MTADLHEEQDKSFIKRPVVKLCAGTCIIKVKPLFTYDSKYVIIVSGSDIKVFNVTSGECVLVFKGHKHPVVSTQTSRNNNLQIMSCSNSGTVLTWDYFEGKILKEFRLETDEEVTFFSFPTEGNYCFATKSTDKVYWKVYIGSPETGKRKATKVKVIDSISPTVDSCAVSPQGAFVVGISDESLLTYDVKRQLKRKLTHKVKLTCVACHPNEYIVATGDSMGCIIIWTGILGTYQPTRSYHHWHSLSLPCLLFSPEGSHIYSAGRESVLVKWSHKSGVKNTLPRLGLPMCNLAISPDGNYIATSHIDNAIQIISAQYEIIKVIQGLTRGHCQNFGCSELFPYCMLYDKRSQAVVMNGRPGHLQFYNIFKDKQLFQLDVVGQNYICPEQDAHIFNTDVSRFAIDDKGSWLATLEYRNDNETSPEIRLKFWQFDFSSQEFVLNTSIFLPHNKGINCLKFKPNVKVMEEDEMCVPLAVTTSEDNRFKIWSLNDKSNEKLSWSCELVSSYKNLPARDACFSEDGSLLCVVFDCVATLWTPDTNLMKATLCNTSADEHIKTVLFGKKKCNHLLVTQTGSMLTVWNVLTLSVFWNVRSSIQYLIDDSFSDFMTAFTNDNNLFVFKPSDPNPVTVVKNVTTSPVVSAVFVPIPQQTKAGWDNNAQLFFLNKDHELLTILNDNEDENVDMEKLTLQQMQPITPFGVLQAESTLSEVMPAPDIQHLLHGSETSTIEPMNLVCPTYVNPMALCDAIFPSLLKASETNRRKKSKITEEKQDSVDMDIDSHSECDSRTEKTKEQTKTKTDNLRTDFLLIEDYNFLLNPVR